MRFERPDALWLLLLAVPLVVLHLRFGLRRRVEVSSLGIWREVAGLEGGGRRGLRHLHEAALLATSLLALTALVGALADPVTGSPPPGPRRLAVVVDDGVTMHAAVAAPQGHDRLDRADQVAGAALAALDADDVAVVWTCGGPPRVRAGPGRAADVSWSGFARGLTGDFGTLLPSRVEEAARLALRGVTRGDTREGRVLVVTDARGAARVGSDSRVAVCVVGEPGPVPNLALGEVRVVGGDGGQVLLVEVRLTEGDRPPPGPRHVLALRADGSMEAMVELTVDSVPGVVRVPLSATLQSSPARVTLSPHDDFPEDDEAALLLPPRRNLRALVVAPGAVPSPVLRAALEAQSGLLSHEGTLASTPTGAVEVADAADLVVVEGTPVPGLPTRLPSLAFGADGERSVERPVVWAARAHPLLRGCDLSSLRLLRASILRPLPWEETLIECAEGPVAVATERDGVRRVRFGFLPTESTLALEPAFPLLVRNALTWLGGERRLPPYIRAGEPFVPADWLGEGRPPVFVEWGAPDDPMASATRIVATSGTVAPTPRARRQLLVRVHGPHGVEETVARWIPPVDFLIGGEAPAGALTEADMAAWLARTFPPREPAPPLRRRAPWFAGAAAVALLLGALLIGSRRQGQARIVARGTGFAGPASLRTVN